MKILFNLFLFTAIIVSSNILTSCGGCSNSADQEKIAQLEAQIAELQGQKQNPVETATTTGSSADSNSSTSNSSNSTSESYVGTYEFTDEMNNEWLLTLNSDKTATIHKKK